LREQERQEEQERIDSGNYIEVHSLCYLIRFELNSLLFVAEPLTENEESERDRLMDEVVTVLGPFITVIA